MTLEEIKFLSQWQCFLRSLEVAVVKSAQALSGDPEGKKKTLAGQVLDNSIWARDKFAINVASQAGVIAAVNISWSENPEGGHTHAFSIPNVPTFDTALLNACAAVWNAEAKV